MSAAQYRWITYQAGECSAKNTLNRPEKRNALTDDLLVELREAL